MITATAKRKLGVAGAIALALLLSPTPLLPPSALAGAVQGLFGVSWYAAYFTATIGLQLCFYCSLGLLAAFVVKRAPTSRGLLLQIVAIPSFLIFIALITLAMKAGYFPVWITAAVPLTASVIGVALGLGFSNGRGGATLAVLGVALGLTLWSMSGASSEVSNRATEAQLRVLIEASPRLPGGDARFGALLQTAFIGSPHVLSLSAVEQNRASILALGIIVGHEGLAQLAALPAHDKWPSAFVMVRGDASLRADHNLARHFCVSAALTVLENPAVSNAAGLMKELADFQKPGSGFSFNDIVADRAGVRFAVAATHSEAAAKSLQERLRTGFRVDEFFPPVGDLPEHLTIEQFRAAYGGVGSDRYRAQMREIESRLDRCFGLSPHAPGL